jgi:hypothetical protein
MMLPFPEWRPDVADYQQNYTKTATNVVPRGDGYGPWPSLSALTGTLPSACRGFFFGRNADGSVSIFAGTSTKLYELNNTNYTWTDVSKSGGTYTPLDATAQWQFAQFNNFVIAVQANANPQVIDLTSAGSSFADLGGSPPQAAYVTTVNRFLVLSGINGSPYRIQWSGLNAITTWTSGVSQSDFQDVADGGRVNGVSGGEYGLIFQDQTIRPADLRARVAVHVPDRPCGVRPRPDGTLFAGARLGSRVLPLGQGLLCFRSGWRADANRQGARGPDILRSLRQREPAARHRGERSASLAGLFHVQEHGRHARPVRYDPGL